MIETGAIDSQGATSLGADLFVRKRKEVEINLCAEQGTNERPHTGIAVFV
jgi:hypothetical protein